LSYVHPELSLDHATPSPGRSNADVISCDFCSHVFSDWSGYVSHANREHLAAVSFGWSRCDVCHVYFPTLNQVRQHKIQEHQQLLTYQPTHLLTGEHLSTACVRFQ
jgi:hypothetical protein